MLFGIHKPFVIVLMTSLLVACSGSYPFAGPAITQTVETPAQTVTPTRSPTIHLTRSAVAEFFATSDTAVLTPQFTPTVYFEYCKGWGDLTTDGKWATCNKYSDPVIFINQSNQTWQFSYGSFYGHEVLEPCTELLHITNDGAYLYFSLPLNCAMTEPWFPSAIGIFRIDLASGEVDRVLGANYDFQNYSGRTYNVSISPTGRRMAYIADGTRPLTLTIVDLNSGEKRAFQLDPKYLNGGRFAWSDDGTKLALLLSSNPKGEYDDHLISFAFLDLQKTDAMVTFIHEKEPFWITAEMEVTELGVRVEVYGEAPLFYDIETGVVRTISE